MSNNIVDEFWRGYKHCLQMLRVEYRMNQHADFADDVTFPNEMGTLKDFALEVLADAHKELFDHMPENERLCTGVNHD